MIFKRAERLPNPFRVNIVKTGFANQGFNDIYHVVLAMSWFEYFAVTTVLYLSMNTVFAFLYYIGGDSIMNADPSSYWDAFVFSFQTSTTIGYGEMTPATTYADSIVILDTLSGVIFVAITTGLAFARFSRPTARVVFTDTCAVHPFDGEKTLFFRVANARDSHIADASITASVVMADKSKEGIEMQRIYDLDLVRSKTPIFSLSWTVMHVIDDRSPLARLTEAEYESKNVRVVISLTGIDDWSSQTIHAAKIYYHDHIVYGKRFADILTSNEDGSITMDYGVFNDMLDFEPKDKA